MLSTQNKISNITFVGSGISASFTLLNFLTLINKGPRLKKVLSINIIEKSSEFNKEKNEVGVTSLFSWFRGDFGSKSGVKKILKKCDIIPNTDVDITYKNYDWTLDLDNWTEL